MEEEGPGSWAVSGMLECLSPYLVTSMSLWYPRVGQKYRNCEGDFGVKQGPVELPPEGPRICTLQSPFWL